MSSTNAAKQLHMRVQLCTWLSVKTVGQTSQAAQGSAFESKQTGLD